ncbi:hypothetical protein B9Z51_12185 [Limnohabitans sp. T6-5]|uniref:hypothetical protein n=1 Tax=Limnohabitans sp. T6-5 TaxID=1100724 RepID=UPI000D3A502F|nr:hypothetical protein [Limnohabitans sp. T6-5]PUE06704.1 hypothetical protein B9Z51_12185 [Limnohabitans sp. T6-5]
MKPLHLGALTLAWACQAQAAPQTVTLSCAVAYLPARSTWVREVQIDWDRKTIRNVRIDGLTPYSFSIHPHGVSTAIDNERIQIDLRQAQWTSDFRGLASGQGRCETVSR